jgi:hypothetical protein
MMRQVLRGERRSLQSKKENDLEPCLPVLLLITVTSEVPREAAYSIPPHHHHYRNISRSYHTTLFPVLSDRYLAGYGSWKTCQASSGSNNDICHCRCATRLPGRRTTSPIRSKANCATDALSRHQMIDDVRQWLSGRSSPGNHDQEA